MNELTTARNEYAALRDYFNSCGQRIEALRCYREMVRLDREIVQEWERTNAMRTFTLLDD